MTTINQTPPPCNGANNASVGPYSEEEAIRSGQELGEFEVSSADYADQFQALDHEIEVKEQNLENMQRQIGQKPADKAAQKELKNEIDTLRARREMYEYTMDGADFDSIESIDAEIEDKRNELDSMQRQIGQKPADKAAQKELGNEIDSLVAQREFMEMQEAGEEIDINALNEEISQKEEDLGQMQRQIGQKPADKAAQSELRNEIDALRAQGVYADLSQLLPDQEIQDQANDYLNDTGFSFTDTSSTTESFADLENGNPSGDPTLESVP